MPVYDFSLMAAEDLEIEEDDFEIDFGEDKTQILRKLGFSAFAGTTDAVIYACKKKNKKLKRKGVGCIPIFGSICNTVYTIGRTIQKKVKGNKGVERRHHAKVLWTNATMGDRCAIAACKEMLGIKIYTMIEGMADGDLVLKKKMKSL